MARAKKPTTPALRNPARSAASSLRGYRYQLLYTVQRSLELDSKTLLLIEGNEDIDRIGLEATTPATIEEQIKLRSSRLGWKSVTDVLLNFSVAFAHHHHAKRKFRGVLRTNATIARGPACALRRWIEGKRPNHAEILRELRKLTLGTTNKTIADAIAYISKGDRVYLMVASVEWAFSGPEPDEVEAHIKGLLKARVPHILPSVALGVLTSVLLKRATGESLSERALSKIDIDIALNDLLLAQLANDFEQENAVKSFAIVSHLDTDAAVAVVVLGFRINQLERYVDRACARQLMFGQQPDRTNVIRANIAELDFIACASLKLSGRRRQAVCLRDLLHQARHRWTLDSISMPQETVQVAQPILKRVMPSAKVHVDDDADLVRIGRIVAAAVIAYIRGSKDDEIILRSIDQKLRWLHWIDKGTFFTADSPLLPPLELKPD